MINHEHFDLLLHTDEELASALGEPIVERIHLHSWPLSCVYRVRTLSGARWIYKSQREPSVELAFYDKNGSPALPPHRSLGSQNGHFWMVIKDLGDASVEGLDVESIAKFQLMRDALELVAQFDRDLPVFIDIEGVEAWQRFASHVIGDLSALVESGTFANIKEDDLDGIRKWTQSLPVLRLVDQEASLTQGDPQPEHVFVMDEGFQVIDWQRPRRCPKGVDLVAIVRQLELAPSLECIDPAVVQLHDFLAMSWPIECEVRWLPSKGAYEPWVLSCIKRLLRHV